MSSLKSLRPRSSPEEITRAFERAVKAIRGTSSGLTKRAIAERAALYLPETKNVLLKKLEGMSEDEYRILLESSAVVGSMQRTLSARETRPRWLGWWAINRKNMTGD